MTRLMLFGVWTATAALTVACGSDRTARNNTTAGATAPPAAEFRGKASDPPTPVDVSGCLTASGDRFELTRLETPAAAGTPSVPTTDAYQLVGGSPADLHKYVGQQVHVTGEADPPRVAEVHESTPPVGTSGANERSAATQPKVSTEETTHLELRTLRVSSITAAGGPCPTPGGAGR